MGLVRRFKSWVKRTAVRIFLKFARTRFGRFIERVAKASAVPLAITGVGAFVGTGVASAAALPLGYGALVGAGVALVAIAATKLYQKNVEQRRTRKRMKLNYTIWSRKVIGNSSHTTFSESSSKKDKRSSRLQNYLEIHSHSNSSSR